MTLKELRAALAALISVRKEITDKITGAKDEAELDAIELDLRKNEIQIKQLNEQIAAKEAEEEIDAAGVRTEDSGNSEERSLRPLNSVINPAPQKNDEEENDMKYRKAFMQFVLRKQPIPMELRANEVTMTTDVSAVIPTVLVNRIVEELSSHGNILPLITQTNYKGGVSIPVSNVRPVATWVAEGSGSDKQKKTVQESITFTYHKLRCAIAMTLETTVVTLQVFEDTFVRQAIEAMYIALEKAVINGTGSGQPKGILAETAKSGQALTAAELTYQLLVEAEAALPTAYENGARWCMTKKTFMGFIGMVDGAGQPIARVNAGFAGKPERTLLGRPVEITDHLDSYSASLAKGKVFAFLFNFKDYVLNKNMDLITKFYEDNDTDDQNFKAIMLADGKVVDKGSLVTIAKAEA